MNIQLRSYLEAELSKARVEEGRLTLELTAAQKHLDDLTRQMDDRSALIAGMRKLLAKADADEVASPAKKDESKQAQEEPEPASTDDVWMPAWEVSDRQMELALSRREVRGPGSLHVEYLIPRDMLTDAQGGKKS